MTNNTFHINLLPGNVYRNNSEERLDLVISFQIDNYGLGGMHFSSIAPRELFTVLSVSEPDMQELGQLEVLKIDVLTWNGIRGSMYNTLEDLSNKIVLEPIP